MNNHFKNFANKFRHSKKALSPAIAIALLLAITIALVAAVGYSATVVTPKISNAPQAAFDVNIYHDSGVVIKEISGDSIPTSDLNLKFVYNDVETLVKPTGNNTFYLNWALFNPDPYTTHGKDPLNDGYSYRYYTGEEFELHDDDGNPLELTAIGIHLTDTISASGNDLVDPDGNWLESGIKVWLGNSSSNIWVEAGPLAPNPETMEYKEAWHACTAPFQMYYIANTDNSTYKNVRVESPSGTTFTIDVPLYGTMDAEHKLDQGHALFLRLSEYNSPFMWQASTVPTRDIDASFGNFALAPGTTMQSVGSAYAPYGIFGNNALISNWNDIAAGDTVTVYIIYSPSSQVIWQGDVVVQ